MASPRVLIVGAGVAGLEAALALRKLAPGRVDVRVRDPGTEFVYRPFAVGAPFASARATRCDLRELVERAGGSFKNESIVLVDTDRRRALTHDGEQIRYDFLVLAIGARMLAPMPGATTFWGNDDDGGIGRIVRRLLAGELRDLVFTLPAGHSWTLPIYELALLASAELRRAGRRDVRLRVATPEGAPLQLFGPRAVEQMEDLLDLRGVEVVTGVRPESFGDGTLRLESGEELATEAVISLPRLEGRRISGIPHDEEGFVSVDEHERVVGLGNVFAVGDVTAFPVKQGGIATQQADAAAEAIATEWSREAQPRPFDPVLRGVLWTGEKQRYIYGRLTGGSGETSILAEEPPWTHQPGKIMGRYLAPFLAAAVDLDRDPTAVAGGAQLNQASLSGH